MSGRNRRRRDGGRRGSPNPAHSADDGPDSWIDYCGGRMFVVGYTEGGAPYGHVEWTTAALVDHDDASIPGEEGPEPF